MSRELDEACARALGWELRHVDGQDYYYMPVLNAMMPVGEFEPSENCDAARKLEDEIERRGLWREYATVLARMVAPGAVEASPGLWHVGPIDLWSLVHATPEQRARVFLEVTKTE